MANTHSLDLESGSSQYASITDGSQTGLDVTGNFTAEAWVKLESLGQSDFTGLVTKRSNAGGGWAFLLMNNNSVRAQLPIVGLGSCDTPANAVGLGWNHIAFTHNATTGDVLSYVNGVLVATTNGNTGTFTDANVNFGVGCSFNGAGDTAQYFYDGLIDEVRVWDDIRTATEIKTNMFADVTGQSNLQGYWKLNNDYTDSSSNGNTLTASGSPSFSTDVRMQAYREIDPKLYSLDLESGSSQYASITDAAQTGLDITGDMTLECWWKPESLSTVQTFISKWEDSGGQNQRSYFLRYNSGGTSLQFYVSSDGTTTVAATHVQVLTAGQWYHLAASYDASAGTAELYINGINVASPTGLHTSAFDSDAPLAIGCTNPDTPGNFVDGLIDEVRVWNDIRTSDEIKENMFKKLAGTEANLQGYWKLENDYTDETSNGNDLTASGSPVFSSTTPFPYYADAVAQTALGDNEQISQANLVGYWKLEDLTDEQGSYDLTNNNTATFTEGQFNNAGTFASASSQYLSHTSPANLKISGAQSWSCWVKPTTIVSYQQLMGLANTDGSARRGLLMDADTGNSILFELNGLTTTAQVYSHEGAIETGSWFHVVGVYTGSALNIYVNGILVGTGVASGSPSAITERFAIGARGGSAAYYVNGQIDDAAIFSRALTADEVYDLYAEGSVTSTAGGNFFLMF